MKLVSFIISTLILSFGAAAQTAGSEAQKNAVAKTQQTTKAQKAKRAHSKAAVATTTAVITLADEKTYKAKWSFEQMLARRLEVDAEDGERGRKNE